jgi:hypothetical protein
MAVCSFSVLNLLLAIDAMMPPTHIMHDMHSRSIRQLKPSARPDKIVWALVAPFFRPRLLRAQSAESLTYPVAIK